MKREDAIVYANYVKKEILDIIINFHNQRKSREYIDNIFHFGISEDDYKYLILHKNDYDPDNIISVNECVIQILKHKTGYNWSSPFLKKYNKSDIPKYIEWKHKLYNPDISDEENHKLFTEYYNQEITYKRYLNLENPEFKWF